MFDDRADTYCLVTSDFSDFAYLCRKLRERGATVHIVGEAKSPDALRNASDQFFEWIRPELTAPATELADKVARTLNGEKPDQPKSELAKPPVKRRPRFVIEAVDLLADATSDGKVALGSLGSYLKRTDPAFSPQIYGHSGLLDMIKTYDLLLAQQEPGGHWSVMRPSAPGLEANISQPVQELSA